MTDCKNFNYTDEYCASGECTSQRPRNDLATASQVSDLTEQWKKGELPEGWYWVKYYDEPDDEIVIDYWEKKVGDWRNYLGIKEVLAPVPSYAELQSMNEAVNQDMAANIKLVEKFNRAKWWLCEIVKNHRYTPISTAEMALKEIEELDNA
jgi:hypothetical protein